MLLQLNCEIIALLPTATVQYSKLKTCYLKMSTVSSFHGMQEKVAQKVTKKSIRRVQKGAKRVQKVQIGSKGLDSSMGFKRVLTSRRISYSSPSASLQRFCRAHALMAAL